MAFDDTELVFKTRMDEVKQFYAYVKTVEIDSLSKSDLSERLLVLKSSILLMLYNLIESVVTSCLHDLYVSIVESINSLKKKNRYVIMTKEIRRIWADNYFKNWTANIQNHKRDASIDALDDIFTIQLKESQFGNLRFITSDGELDAKRIREIFLSYGIELNIDSSCQQERLFFIKNKRNQLAHGGESFHQASRDLSVDDINNYCIATFSFIDCMILSVKQYCLNEKFINANNGNEYPFV